MPKILIPLLLLGSFNLLMTSSLSPHLLLKQILLWLTGLILFYLGRHLNPTLTSKSAWLLFILATIFLLLPLVASPLTRGSRRWLSLGPISLQPSELAKPALMLFLANTHFPWVHFLPVLLVALEPDLGSALTLLILFLPTILFHPKALKPALILSLIGLSLSPLIWHFTLKDYQKNRLLTFLNPTADPLNQGYNTIQSKIAIGSAGLWGQGYKKGSQGQLLFLPEKHTDFIFAATVEELGLASAVIIIFTYYFLLKTLIAKATAANNLTQTTFTLGITFLIWTQVFVNIGMNLGILPVTGIPLPFLSVGGSSLVSLMFSLGLIFSS